MWNPEINPRTNKPNAKWVVEQSAKLKNMSIEEVVEQYIELSKYNSETLLTVFGQEIVEFPKDKYKATVAGLKKLGVNF